MVAVATNSRMRRFYELFLLSHLSLMTPLSRMKLTSGNRWFQQQAKSALLSCLALFAVCDRRACNGFFDADPTWFYNPLLSSFRRSRLNRCDVRAMRERSPARRDRPATTATRLQGTAQRRGRGRSDGQDEVHQHCAPPPSWRIRKCPFSKKMQSLCKSLQLLRSYGTPAKPLKGYFEVHGMRIISFLVGSDFTAFTRILRERPKAINK